MLAWLHMLAQVLGHLTEKRKRELDKHTSPPDSRISSKSSANGQLHARSQMHGKGRGGVPALV